MAKRVKQEKLIEIDHEADKPLIAAAERLKELRSEYAGMGKTIKDSAEAVKAIMHERELTVYTHEDLVIRLRPGAEAVIVESHGTTSEPQEDDEAE
jgi:hypothetical protein